MLILLEPFPRLTGRQKVNKAPPPTGIEGGTQFSLLRGYSRIQVASRMAPIARQSGWQSHKRLIGYAFALSPTDAAEREVIRAVETSEEHHS